MISIKEFVNNEKDAIKSYTAIAKKLPTLTIIQVGDVEASNRYVKNKLKDAEEVGIIATLCKLDENVSEESLINIISEVTDDGIIVQLPLPEHINVNNVMKSIPIEKDVDGFRGETLFSSCTPGGIIDYLEAINFTIKESRAVVLGRSMIVGRPIAKMLLDRDATVTICHTKTPKDYLLDVLKSADLVVCATGHRGSLLSSQAPNAFIIDVGINFNDDGKLCGDVIIDDGRFDMVTPVPGGVGLLTRLKLMKNVVEASKK